MSEGIDMKHRATDDAMFRVDRVIPAWGLISLMLTVLTAGVIQGIALYYGQRELTKEMTTNAVQQREETARLAVQVSAMSAQVERLTNGRNTQEMADLKHEMRLDAIDRWRIEVEQQYRLRNK